jgi:hypothetical protein
MKHPHSVPLWRTNEELLPFDLRQLVSRPPIAYCGPSALQEYFDAKSFRLRGDEPHVTESVLP